jgi:hypothetical protein
MTLPLSVTSLFLSLTVMRTDGKPQATHPVVAALQRLGCEVKAEPTVAAPPQLKVGFAGCTDLDSALPHLRGLTNLHTVDL